MVKMTNALFGNEMWVDEKRVEEYLSAGHKLADIPKPQKPKGKTKTAKKTK